MKEKRSVRKIRCKSNLDKLKNLESQRKDFESRQLSPVHIRLFGKYLTVDYWPSTEKAWITNDYAHKSEKMTVEQVIELVTK